MGLEKYIAKRNFNKTTEPQGKIRKGKAMRFVVQYHQARAKHYDFRLEYNGVLLSWAVPKGLSKNPEDKRLAVMVEDHPVDYINFEGIIPKGNYGAGTVEVFDKGEYLPIEDMDKGLKKGHIKIALNGEKLKGGWSLIKIKENNWLIVKLNDEYIDKSGVKKIMNPFKTCKVQLATLSDKIPKGKDWLFEIKYDGYRILSFVENNKVELFSRNNIDYTKRFDKIVSSLKKLEEGAFVLDGEIVAFDEKGKSDFGLLQNIIKTGKGEIYYVVFDLLSLNGEDLRGLPLKERKEKLERLLYKCENNIIFSSHVMEGEKSFKFAKDNDLEGIIAKKINSLYSGTRNEDWIKIKCYQRQEFVVAGYTTSDKNEIISAILLGYYRGKDLVYVGKVGTGLSERMKKDLANKFNKIKRKTNPFSVEIKEANVVWLSPKLVAEIQFAEITKDKLLRQPSFIALRQDKNPKEIVLES